MDTVTTQGVLHGRRTLVCGKGGSGKSTFGALTAAALQRRGRDVVVLDGDAANLIEALKLCVSGNGPLPNAPAPCVNQV